jgi:hypothetical protein
VGGGSYPGKEPLKASIIFKVRSIALEKLAEVLEALEGVELIDIREA